ncbi:MAG TPA: hypothetical protein VFW77_00620 [Candidatus Saccharimonadales bacterium]|nr:hypothetical protein [Candidatus Saccharimonadales bacterium]
MKITRKVSEFTKLWLAVVLVVSITAVNILHFGSQDKALAAASSTINFQARLLSNSGALVPDGYYNVEFKLYSASSGGSAQWTETYYDSNGVTAGNDNRVRVVNGYLSVYLGSQTALPSIDWSQEEWLTINIGGTTQTATPTWDGEMNPRLKLSAVPYAFTAGNLAKTTGANTSTLDWDTQTAANSILLPDESGTLCIQGSTNCGFAAASGSGSYIQNGTSAQTADFNITGDGTLGGTLQAATVNATGTIELNGTDINVGTTLSNVAYLDQANSFSQNQTITKAGGKTTLALTSTGSNTGITLGGDTNLYRSSANNLKTDDNLLIASSASIGGLGVQANITLFASRTSTLTSGVASLVEGQLSANPASNSTASFLGGTFQSATSGTHDINTVEGLEGDGYHFGTGTVTNGYGVLGFYQNSIGSGGTTTNAVGTMGEISNQTNGSITNAAGLQALVRNQGTDINTGYGLQVLSATNTGGGTFENNYGIYIQDQSGVGSTNSYNLYSAGATAQNYIEGTLDVGGTVNTDSQYNINGFQALAMRGNTTIHIGDGGSSLNGADNFGAGFLTLDSTSVDSFENVAVGNYSLDLNNDGWDNTAVGVGALGDNTDGGQNTALGSYSGSGNSTGTGNTFIGYDSGLGTATQLQNATAIGIHSVVSQDDSLVLGCINTVNGCTATTKVGIGTATPGYTLDVNGDINISGGSSYRIGGTAICTSSGCTPSSGSGNYIQNTTTQQTSANFNIDGSGTIGTDLTVNGAALFQNSNDSTNAFQIQDSSSSVLLNEDTSNQQLTVSKDATTNYPVLTVQNSSGGDAALETRSGSQSFFAGVDATDGNYKISSSQSAGSTATVGYNTIGGTDGTTQHDKMTATKFTTGGSGGTVTSMSVYTQALTGAPPNNQFQVAIYTDNAGLPGTLIANSASGTLTGNSWVSVPITATLSAGTTYWLVYNTNAGGNGNNNLMYDAGTAGQYQQIAQTFGTWPSSFGTPTSSQNRVSSIYATYTVDGYANLFNTSLFSLSGTGQALFQNSTDSPTAFQIQDASSNVLLTADTSLAWADLSIGSSGFTSGANLNFRNNSNSNTWDLETNDVGLGGTDGLSLYNWTDGAYVLGFSNQGAATFKNSTDSSEGFAIQDAAGFNVAAFNTSSNYASLTLGGSDRDYSELDLKYNGSDAWALGTDNGGDTYDAGGFYLYNYTNSVPNFALTADGAATFKNSTDSGNAFQVQNASGDEALNVDTIDMTTTLQAGTDSAALGTEIFTGSTSFTSGSGWTSNGLTGQSASITHTTGTTAKSPSPALSIASGTYYLVSWDVTNPNSGGTLNITMGGQTVATYSFDDNDSGTYTFSDSAIIQTSSTTNLSFTPNSAFTGSISNISVKQLTFNDAPVLVINNTSGAPNLEIRASSSFDNLFMGDGSGAANITGDGNLALGTFTLQNNVSGDENTVLGQNALQNNISGDDNTAIGFAALNSNTTGWGNIAVGAYALNSNLQGTTNVAVGNNSLQLNTDGYDNIGVGDNTLFSNTTGNQQVAIGSGSLESNTTGTSNTGLGYATLRDNVTGYNNTAAGTFALEHTTAAENAAFGTVALREDTSGEQNSAFGTYALSSNTTGSNNAGFGYLALANNLTGQYNTALGDEADVMYGDLQGATAVGSGSAVGSNNSIILGYNFDYGVDDTVGIGTSYAPNPLTVKPNYYSEGTITQSSGSGSVVGSGTSFTSAMVGGTIYYPDHTTGIITAVADGTHLTSSNTTGGWTSRNDFEIIYGGFNVNSDATVLLQPTSDSATAFQVQDSSGGTLFDVDSNDGGVIIGAADSPNTGDDNTQGTLRIVGTGDYGGLGRILFGDGNLTDNQNVWLGEYSAGGGTDDTDILQLQGKNGVQITTEDDASLTVADFFGDVDTLDGYGTGINALAVAKFNDRATFGYDGSTQDAMIQGDGGKGFRLYTDGHDSTDYSTFGVDTDGAATFRNYNDTDAAFQIQNAGGTALFVADTSNSKITVQNATLQAQNIDIPTSSPSTITRTSRTSASSSVSYGTGSYTPAGTFSPAANKLLLAFVNWEANDVAMATDGSDITISGGSLTWVPVTAKFLRNNGWGVGQRVFYAYTTDSPPANMQVTVDAGTYNISRYHVAVDEMSGVDPVAPVAGAVSASRQSNSNNVFTADLTRNPESADWKVVVGTLDQDSGIHEWDTPSGWTEIHSLSPEPDSTVMYRTSTTATTLNYDLGSSLDYSNADTVYGGFILKAAGGAGLNIGANNAQYINIGDSVTIQRTTGAATFYADDQTNAFTVLNAEQYQIFNIDTAGTATYATVGIGGSGTTDGAELDLNYGTTEWDLGAGGWASGFYVENDAGNRVVNITSSGAIKLNDGVTNGTLTADIAGTDSTHKAVCHSGTGTDNVQIVDCTGTPIADYAENYPVASGVSYGDIVATGTNVVNTYGTDSNGGIDWTNVKGQVTQLVKSDTIYQTNTIGIVSNNHDDFTSAGYNIKKKDNPMPVALNGRVPVNVSPGSDSIQPGDYLTTSSDSGKATKAAHAGFVIGKALEAWNPSSGKTQVMVYVEQGYWPGPTQTDMIQNGGNASLDELTANVATINQITASNATITNLSVSGTATIGTLHITGDSVFDGKVTISSAFITKGDAPTIDYMDASWKDNDPNTIEQNQATATVDGNDIAGTITLKTGDNPTAGQLLKLIYNTPFDNPPKVIFSPANDNAADLKVFRDETTGEYFILKSTNAPAANTTYKFDYFIVQAQQ